MLTALENGHHPLDRNAAEALKRWALLDGVPEYMANVCGDQALMRAVKLGLGDTPVLAMETIWILLSKEATHSILLQHDVIAFLVEIIQESDDKLKLHAVTAMQQLVKCQQSGQALRQARDSIAKALRPVAERMDDSEMHQAAMYICDALQIQI